MPQVKKTQLIYIGGNGPAAKDFAENHGLELVRYPNAEAVQPGDLVIVDFANPVPESVPNQESAIVATINAVRKGAFVLLAYSLPVTTDGVLNFWRTCAFTMVAETNAAGLVFLDRT